jgi:hypothetical protein
VSRRVCVIASLAGRVNGGTDQGGVGHKSRKVDGGQNHGNLAVGMGLSVLTGGRGGDS